MVWNEKLKVCLKPSGIFQNLVPKIIKHVKLNFRDVQENRWSS